jgi:hypothetical protein
MGPFDRNTVLAIHEYIPNSKRRGVFLYQANGNGLLAIVQVNYAPKAFCRRYFEIIGVRNFF